MRGGVVAGAGLAEADVERDVVVEEEHVLLDHQDPWLRRCRGRRRGPRRRRAGVRSPTWPL
jgi:hypothetical protein